MWIVFSPKSACCFITPCFLYSFFDIYFWGSKLLSGWLLRNLPVKENLIKKINRNACFMGSVMTFQTLCICGIRTDDSELVIQIWLLLWYISCKRTKCENPWQRTSHSIQIFGPKDLIPGKTKGFTYCIPWENTIYAVPAGDNQKFPLPYITYHHILWGHN